MNYDTAAVLTERQFDLEAMWGTIQSHDDEGDPAGLDVMLDALRNLVLDEHRARLAAQPPQDEGCPRCGRAEGWSGPTAPGAPCMGCGRYPAVQPVPPQDDPQPDEREALAWDRGYMRGRHPWQTTDPDEPDPIPESDAPPRRGRNANPYRAALPEPTPEGD